MKTEDFLAAVAPKGAYAQPKEHIPCEKAVIWIGNHSTVYKVGAIAFLIIGAILFTTALAGSWSMMATVCLIIGGFLSSTAFAIACFIGQFFPFHHDMKHHVYKSQKSQFGELFYQNDLPILKIDNDNPYNAGYAQGHMLGDQIQQLRWRLNLIDKITRQPKAANLPNLLENVKRTIPKAYLTELQGMVDGFNKWAKHKFWVRRLSLDEALLLQLVPETLHLRKEETEKNYQKGKAHPFPQIACSTVMGRDKKSGIVVARQMDWPSWGVTAANSIVIARTSQGKVKTVDVTVPGLLGSMTGMNEHGFSVAMNVCPGFSDTVSGVPSTILNRICLNECKSVAEAKTFLQKNPAMGPYHLSLADPESAEIIHLRQKTNRIYTTHSIDYECKDEEFYSAESLQQEKKGPLIVCNSNIHIGLSGFLAKEREDRLSSYFKDAYQHIPDDSLDMKALLEHGLGLPLVNNFISMHSVVMVPKSRSISMAFDNSYSANAPRAKIDLF